jgi:polyhydroxyalkanoate synthesis regulator phasin
MAKKKEEQDGQSEAQDVDVSAELAKANARIDALETKVAALADQCKGFRR